jgi:polysaccharide biosynthesis protein VpsI
MFNKNIVILGTSARGGIKSVIKAYELGGFYSSGSYCYIATHSEGIILKRLLIALIAYLRVGFLLMIGKVRLLHLHLAARGSFWRKSIFVIMGRIFRIPVLIHLHGSKFDVFYDNSFHLGKKIIRFIFDQSNAIVVLSESWKVYVAQLTKTQIKVINNFVSDYFDSKYFNNKRDYYCFLYLGQFGNRKGIYDLLSSFQIVTSLHKKAILYCGGNGEESKVRNRVNELGINDSVRILGWVSGKDKLELMHKCAFFVLPSYHEGLPMAIIEAMSFAMTIISTPVGGIPELVDSNNGFLVKPGNQRELADALIEALKKKEAEIDMLGAESRRRYQERFSPQIVMKKMRELYFDLGVSP